MAKDAVGLIWVMVMSSTSDIPNTNSQLYTVIAARGGGGGRGRGRGTRVLDSPSYHSSRLLEVM